jgi:hypothetical protein
MLLTAKQAMIKKIFFFETSKKGDMSQPMKSMGFNTLNSIILMKSLLSINYILAYRD